MEHMFNIFSVEPIEVYEVLFREGFKSRNFNAIADCNICMALLT